MSISILSWNIMGGTWDFIHGTPINFLTKKVYPKKVSRYLNKLKNIDVYCLQELPVDFEKLIVKDNFPHYTTIKSEIINKVEVSTAFLSKVPIISHGKVSLKKYRGNESEWIRESTCLWIDIAPERKRMRIYNCRLQIRNISIKQRIELLGVILEHSRDLDCPVVVCGDMNTTIPKESWKRKVTQWIYKTPTKDMYLNGKYCIHDERYYFIEEVKKYGFKELLDIKQSTWFLPYTCIEFFSLKLDWFMTRNIKTISYEFGPCITDHKPIIVNLNLKS